MSRKLCVAAASFVFAISPPALAITFTVLDYPGSSHTEAWGISGGNVVGLYKDSQGYAHGFLYDGGTYSEIHVPTSGSVAAYGIDGATIVGAFDDATGIHGFIDSAGAFQTLDAPNSTYTQPFAVDGSNIVGQYLDQAGKSHGFLYDGEIWTTLDYPATGNFSYSIPYGISNGTIGFEISGGFEALYQNGAFTDFKLPGAYSTGIHGLDRSLIVGDYTDFTETLHGFVFNGTEFIPLDYPGSTSTIANGVDGGAIVGAYADSAGITHGFLATVAEPSAGLIAVIGLAVITVFCRSQRGQAELLRRRSSSRSLAASSKRSSAMACCKSNFN